MQMCAGPFDWWERQQMQADGLRTRALGRDASKVGEALLAHIGLLRVYNYAALVFQCFEGIELRHVHMAATSLVLVLR
jgi:hypothetical protein